MKNGWQEGVSSRAGHQHGAGPILVTSKDSPSLACHRCRNGWESPLNGWTSRCDCSGGDEPAVAESRDEGKTWDLGRISVKDRHGSAATHVLVDKEPVRARGTADLMLICGQKVRSHSQVPVTLCNFTGSAP